MTPLNSVEWMLVFVIFFLLFMGVVVISQDRQERAHRRSKAKS